MRLNVHLPLKWAPAAPEKLEKKKKATMGRLDRVSVRSSTTFGNKNKASTVFVLFFTDEKKSFIFSVVFVSWENSKQCLRHPFKKKEISLEVNL